VLCREWRCLGMPFTWWWKMLKIESSYIVYLGSLFIWKFKAMVGSSMNVHTTQWAPPLTLFYGWEEGKNTLKNPTLKWVEKNHRLQCNSAKCAILGCVIMSLENMAPPHAPFHFFGLLGNSRSPPLPSIINLKHAPSLSTATSTSETHLHYLSPKWQKQIPKPQKGTTLAHLPHPCP